MALTLRQRALIHIVVQRFDRETQTTTLESAALASELSADRLELARDIEVLLAEGYVEKVGDDSWAGGTDEGAPDSWVLNPTDRAVMSAMGLE